MRMHPLAHKCSLSDCDWTRTQNHLVRTRTLNHWASLAKWLSVCLRTKWFWVWVQLQSHKIQISCLLQARRSLTFRQLQSVDSLWNVWHDKNIQSHKCTFLFSIFWCYLLVLVVFQELFLQNLLLEEMLSWYWSNWLVISLMMLVW